MTTGPMNTFTANASTSAPSSDRSSSARASSTRAPFTRASSTVASSTRAPSTRAPSTRASSVMAPSTTPRYIWVPYDPPESLFPNHGTSFPRNLDFPTLEFQGLAPNPPSPSTPTPEPNDTTNTNINTTPWYQRSIPDLLTDIFWFLILDPDCNAPHDRHNPPIEGIQARRQREEERARDLSANWHLLQRHECRDETEEWQHVRRHCGIGRRLYGTMPDS